MEDDIGVLKKAIQPYIMDLNSSNGTYLNGERLQSARYYEVREKVSFLLSNTEVSKGCKENTKFLEN